MKKPRMGFTNDEIVDLIAQIPRAQLNRIFHLAATHIERALETIHPDVRPMQRANTVNVAMQALERAGNIGNQAAKMAETRERLKLLIMETESREQLAQGTITIEELNAARLAASRNSGMRFLPSTIVDAEISDSDSATAPVVDDGTGRPNSEG